MYAYQVVVSTTVSVQYTTRLKYKKVIVLRVFGLGGIGLAVVKPHVKLKQDVLWLTRIQINLRWQKSLVQRTLNPKDYDVNQSSKSLSKMTGWGVDHSFECIGNVNVMRAAP